MDESEPAKRRIGTSGELVLGALLGAVLGWPITKALDAWSAENNWPWWIYLLGSVVGVAVVLLGMSLLIRRWRRTIWGPVGRRLKWLWSWHPVSARRLKKLQPDRSDEVIKLTLLTSVPAIVRHIIKDDDEFESRMKRLITPIVDERIRKLQVARLEEQTRAPQIPSPPLPRPRWTVQMDEDTYGDFHLSNAVPRSVAREVRIEGDVDCTITSAGAWEDLSGESSGPFTARLSGEATTAGVQFTIYWYDEAGSLQDGKYFLSGEDIRRARAY